MSPTLRRLSVPLALVALFGAPASLADGKCERTNWELALDARASTFPTEAEAARWSDGHLLGSEGGFAVDLGADGTIDFETEYPATARLRLPLALATGCANYSCGSEAGGAFVVSSASRAELVGATFTVDSERAVLAFVADDAPVEVVWALGDWLGQR